MRKVWIGLGVVIAVVAVVLGGGWLVRERVAEAGMRRLYEAALATDPLAELPDGLHVGLCGSGAPMPDPTRAGPCVAVVAGRDLFVVDAGSGSTRNLLLMNLPPPRLSAAFVTHYHSDHIADLGELMLQRWGGGATQAPLPIYGPPGLERVVSGFMTAYELDRGYRIAHHGETVMPPSGFGGAAHVFTADPNGPDVLVLEKPGLKIWAFPVRHDPVHPAVAYRFEYKGRTAVISGDTGPSERLVRAARGVDLLVHEGLSPNLVAIQRDVAEKAGRDNYAHIFHDILSYHTAPETVAREAKTAGVKAVLFYHIIPPLPVRALEGPFLGRSRQIFSGSMKVGRDGDFATLPAGGDEIRWSNRLALLKL